MNAYLVGGALPSGGRDRPEPRGLADNFLGVAAAIGGVPRVLDRDPVPVRDVCFLPVGEALLHHRTTGPAFSAMPWNQNTVTDATVGDLTITFANGNHASFHYTLNLGAGPIDQTKTIERFVFRSPGTVCH